MTLLFTGGAGGFEFFIARQMNEGVFAGETVPGTDIADGRVQALVVIVFNEVPGDAFGIVERERGLGADGLGFQGLMEALNLAVGLRVVRAGHDVARLPLIDKDPELSGFVLGALVGD